MTDSYFNNDDTMPNDVFEESLVSDEEDDDYNAFNNETFGEDTWGGDWEEDHEKMAEIAELSRHHFNDDDSELSSKIANFILDDDDVVSKTNRFLGEFSDDELNGDDTQRVPNNLGFSHSVASSFQSNISSSREPDYSQPQMRPKPRPPPGFVDNQPPFPMPLELPKPMNLKNICTVEEIERSLRKPPPTSLRLEDLERNLMSSVTVSVNNMVLRSGLVRALPRLPSGRSATLSGVRVPPPAPGRPQTINILPPFLPPHPLLIQQHQLNNRTIMPVGSAQQNNIANMQQVPVPANLPSNVDPYDGLMTYREKQWVASIQIMQISANPTYQNDYYYIMYQHRQSGGRKINALKNRDVGNSNKNAQYTPQQFENSLGKIQACSVTAPRKIIDMDIVEKTAVDSATSQASSSSKKFKQILLEIEQMYSDVLKAEEAISPLLVVPPDPHVDPKALFIKTVTTLLKKDNLSTILNIRKGKALVVRVMSHPEVCSELARSLLALLPGVAKADEEDQALLRALPSVRHYLQSTTSEELVNLSIFLRPHLSFLLYNKFGISVIANLLERGEALDMNSKEWCQFISSLGSCVSKDSAKEPQRPVVGIPGPVLSRLLARANPPLSPSHLNLLTRSLATLASIQS